MSSLPHFSEAQIRYQLEHGHENRSYIVTTVTTVFFICALTCVVLRLYARKKLGVKYKAEDHLIVVSLALAAGLWTVALLAVRFGVGQHTMKVFVDNGVNGSIKLRQTVFALKVNYNFAHLTVKLAVLMFYRTIFTLLLTNFRRAWYFVLVYVVVNFITCIILVFIQCSPVSFFWDVLRGGKGHCIDLRLVDIGAGAAVLAADLMLLILPMPMFISLTLPLKKRILLCGLFALGLLAVISSAVRLWSIIRVTDSSDLTWVSVEPLIWSIVEVDLGVICACIPTLKPLFSKKGKDTSTKATASSHSQSTAAKRRMDNSSSSWTKSDPEIGDARGGILSPVYSPGRLGYVKTPSNAELEMGYIRARGDPHE